MEIQINYQHNKNIIALIGRMDALSSPEFDSATKKVIEETTEPVVLLLNKLEYISSAGLRSMLVLAKALKAKNIKLTFVALQPAVLEVFTISGFASIFKIVQSLEEIE